MIPTTLTYQNEMLKPIRGATRVKIIYGIESDVEILSSDYYPTTLKYGSGSFESLYTELVDPTSDYIYLSKDYFRTNGTQKILPQSSGDLDTNAGFIIDYISDSVLNEKGYLYSIESLYPSETSYPSTDSYPIVGGLHAVYYHLSFVNGVDTDPKSIEGFEIDFDDINNTYATYIRIVAMNDTLTVYDENIDNNSDKFIFDTALTNITDIYIYPLYINKPSALLRLTNVFIGVSKTYTEQDLDQKGFSYKRFINPTSSELSYSEFSFTINNIDKKYNPFSANGIYSKFDQSQPVKLLIGRDIGDNDIYWLEVANLVTDEITFDETTFTIKCVDLLSTMEQVNYYTKYNEFAITETWEDMIHELLYNIDVGITSDDLILTSKLQDENATSYGFPVKSNELLQLIANVNNHIVFTNRLGQIEFIDAWNPTVTVTDNGHYRFSDVQAAYDTIELPTESYIQLTQDYFKTSVDTFQLIPPVDEEDFRALGYVSSYIGDVNGDFSTYPVITITYSLPTNIDNLYLVFDHLMEEYPIQFDVDYYDENDLLILNKPYTTNSLYEISESIDIENCLYFTITIKQWSVPYHRAVVNRIGNGRIDDYYLSYDNIKTNPSIIRADYVKEINCKYHTYTGEDDFVDVYTTTIYGDGLHSLFSDTSYWYTNIIKVSGTGTIDAIYNAYSNAVHFEVSGNTSGMEVTFQGKMLNDTSLSYKTIYNEKGTAYSIDNPFCTTTEIASRLNMWYYDYVKKGESLTISYRGEPALEPYDFIYVQTQFQDKVPCVIKSIKLDYNGGLSGKLEVIVV